MRLETTALTKLWYVCIVAAMGGLLFGYDWVVIGGAKPFYEAYFGLTSPAAIGWAVSSALIGAMLGVIFCGISADRLGRKKLLITAAFLLIVSAVGTGLSNTFTVFILYRIAGGIGVGLSSNLSPMYIAEISPPHLRGRFVSVNQLTIVVGILAAQIVNWMIAEKVPTHYTAEQFLYSWNVQHGWRWMFIAEIVPASLFFILMFTLPESPRWLVRRGDHHNALHVLTKTYNRLYAKEQLDSIKLSLVHETKKTNFNELLEPGMKKVIGIGIFLAVFQQWCGINIMFNYADEIFSAAGFHVGDLLFNIIITGIVNVVFTVIAIYTVDRFGRKRLMLLGSAGLAICHGLIALSYYRATSGLHVLILLVGAIAFFAFSMAPITWVLLSEIYPNRIRAAAMAVSVLALWASSFVITYFFPSLNMVLGHAGTFLFFSLFCVIGFVFFSLFLPETKNKTLEQIELELVKQTNVIT